MNCEQYIEREQNGTQSIIKPPTRQHSTQFSLAKDLPDESVDFGDVNVIQLLDSVFDLVLVCLDVHNEHKCVVVLNLLHGGLCCQGELDDGIVIQPTGKRFISLHISHCPDYTPSLIACHYKHVTCFSGVHQ